MLKRRANAMPKVKPKSRYMGEGAGRVYVRARFAPEASNCDTFASGYHRSLKTFGFHPSLRSASLSAFSAASLTSISILSRARKTLLCK